MAFQRNEAEKMTLQHEQFTINVRELGEKAVEKWIVRAKKEQLKNVKSSSKD